MKQSAIQRMSVEMHLQNASAATDTPSEEDFRRWAEAALESEESAVLTIRLVDREESRALNSGFRHQDKPTNVLSFPADLPPEIDLALLGDIVICAPLVEQEAKEQGKPALAHWAHLSIHGIFHLLGYDHQNDEQACEMEALEVACLDRLGFPNPYL